MTSTNAAPGLTPVKQSTNGPRIVTMVVATLVGAAVWFVARVAFDVKVIAKTGATETTVQLPSVIVAGVLSGLLGWGLLELLERKASKPGTVWSVIASVVLVLSLFTGPLNGVTTGAKVTLVLLHLAVGLVLIAGLARTARKR
ncbi:hypothetical protein E4198_17980 [Streptomyces sp. RKND-216]|uniref:DUF6069 family protein n=1 Tax=Streptomyces hazeniae TaxID=3075538 RepID=A0ABU2NL57_9ACTN|nr:MULTISPECIES: DUF6069 family protein [unclassified Streptomyces]MDT0377716.1 DUF6069 family protein [Streptomyces sp. DSM 42041]THA26324.1 hypothetical protein E4198_17980 [Streptomyces sp. RKND-216]